MGKAKLTEYLSKAMPSTEATDFRTAEQLKDFAAEEGVSPKK
jgi:hypothetical protein